jgi:hypothetical protein
MPDESPKEIGAISKTGSGAPTATPPAGKSVKAGGAGAPGSAGAVKTVWNNSQIVNALWTINQDRNSWLGIQGVGWLKLSTASDTGVVALTVLASHAKQMQTVINYRVEDDGMVHEIYAW